MRSARGFSLVEVVVSASLIAAALLVVFNLFPKGAESVAYHQSRMLAATLAESLLSKARADGWERVQPTTGREEMRSAYAGRDLVTTFDYEQTVDPVGTDLKRVSACVRWPERSGRGSLTMSTVVRRVAGTRP